MLNKLEYKTMEEYYGLKWYLKFFNIYHVNHIINNINNTTSQKEELINKYGEQWFEMHIQKFNIIDKKIIYSYEGKLIHDNKYRKKNRAMGIDTDNIQNNYLTNKKIDLPKIMAERSVRSTARNKNNKLDKKNRININRLNKKNKTKDVHDTKINNVEYTEFVLKPDLESKHIGGGDDDDVEENVEEEIEDNLEEKTEEEEEDEEDEEEKIDEEDIIPDNDVEETTNLIKNAIDKNVIKNTKEMMINFDESKDNNMYDENLKDIFTKYYVKTQFIFKDDSIAIIKNKICCAIKNNSKFDSNAYLIPSRQYLWCEYFFDNINEKIMIGYKWMKRNEILNIDIEPNNNFRIYEELYEPLNYNSQV